MSPFILSPLLVFFFSLIVSAHQIGPPQEVIARPEAIVNNVPFTTRVHWMRKANAVLSDLTSPCPFAAFASVIVNHTMEGLGELVCVGVNSRGSTGDPTLHGEIAAIRNCTSILTDPAGSQKLTPSQALAAFSQLSLYTNAESCPMCASAIRFSGCREYIYGTSIVTLIEQGWSQIRVSSLEVFKQSFDLPIQARLIGGVLRNETDLLFSWQFNSDAPCPSGCLRSGGSCRPQAT